ncbi:zinc ribbon domain-containing protein [Halopenitus sp. H-Gu1]|uniref:double zinc ribbon domain-containing protein n=1 Tax=Halopenitus sp. H-Gu1 TaxID=3242697 RepID=UPI00359EB68D
MSKITFRADDDLVDRLEEYDASKSEVMREALRTYLGAAEAPDSGSAGSASDVDDAIAERVDDLIADRLDTALDERLGSARLGPRGDAYTPETGRNINVNVTLDGVSVDRSDTVDTEETVPTEEDEERKTRDENTSERTQTDRKACASCGENMPEDHVYCPNCGEKRSHRVFCECGDEIRSDWSFCPGCGRRTPAADVLDTH